MTVEEIERAMLDIKARELHNGTNMRLRNINCTIYQALQKEIPYTCKVEDNKFGYHKCKCGVYFVDKHFDGYCGRCGQKIKW